MPNRTREVELLQAAAAQLEVQGLTTSAHQLEARADALAHLAQEQLVESATADLVADLGVVADPAGVTGSAPA